VCGVNSLAGIDLKVSWPEERGRVGGAIDLLAEGFNISNLHSNMNAEFFASVFPPNPPKFWSNSNAFLLPPNSATHSAIPVKLKLFFFQSHLLLELLMEKSPESRQIQLRLDVILISDSMTPSNLEKVMLCWRSFVERRDYWENGNENEVVGGVGMWPLLKVPSSPSESIIL